VYEGRRFQPPWTVATLDGGFKAVDANKQAIAYVYGSPNSRDAQIAKLPDLLGKGG